MEPKTRKGQETREEILVAAIRLFEERGYDETTLRDIAKEAGVSPGLAYRYFESKEAMVQGLYARLSERFGERVSELPEGDFAFRSLYALDASFEVLSPYRSVLGALLGPMVREPKGGGERPLYAPLAAGEASVRGAFVRAAQGARPIPDDPVWLGEVFYLAHLGMLLFWLVDRSEDQQATKRLRGWIEAMLPWVGPALRVPGLRPAVASLVDILWLGVMGRAR